MPMAINEGHMEKQEPEMKQKLEMEIGTETGNRNAKKRCTNHWCNIFFVVCLLLKYST